MDLREYIDKVKEIGELKVIDGADWDQEIGAISYLVAKATPNPPAVIFDNIKDYKPGFRVLSIPFSTEKRMALALGLPMELEKLELVKAMRAKLAETMKPVPPVEVKDGPILENVYTGDKVDLFMFPTPQWQGGDGGRYIGTGDAVILKDPDEGWVNVGTHRIQIHDKTTATIMHEAGKHGEIIRQKYWSRGQNCPAAVTCGSDPQFVFVSSSKVPWGVSEYDYLGWWRQEAVKVVKGPLTGLPIPADAEIVLEGEMVPPEEETIMEGPFSEGTGHYSPKTPESAFKVKSILHRNDPIMLGMLPFLGYGAATSWSEIVQSAVLWSHLDRLVPGVKGVWAPREANRFVVVSVEQKYGGHAKQVAVAALAQNSYNRKYVIVVDDDIDPTDIYAVFFALAERADSTTWDIIKDSWCNHLHPQLSPWQREVGDITWPATLMMATKPYYWIKNYPALIKSAPEVVERVKQKWPNL
ncbi:UbiD family decarboxylase [Chloroflexota bacterium]